MPADDGPWDNWGLFLVQPIASLAGPAGTIYGGWVCIRSYRTGGFVIYLLEL